jgi:GWxTD domain-containing protein
MASFAIVVNDSVKSYFADRIDLNTPWLKDSVQLGLSYSSYKVIALPAGKFKVSMVIFDGYSTDTLKERLSFQVEIGNAGEKPLLSDLMFLNPAYFNSTKAVFEQDARGIRTSDFYSREDTVIKLYGESFGLLPKLPAGTPLISRIRILESESKKSLDEFGRMKRIKAAENLAIISDLNIKKLPSGNFILIWDLVDSTGKIVAFTYRGFRKSNPGVEYKSDDNLAVAKSDALMAEIEKMNLVESRHLVASLLPVASSSEQSTILYLKKKGTETEIRNYLHKFWLKKSPEKPANALADFRALLVYADKKYSTQTMPAYQTERGRVVLQYGKPNLIENEYSDRNRKAMQNLNTIPYEIWYYYVLDQPVRQSDVMFVFVQQNRGNENYRLLHSSGIGEVRNGEWRKIVENNATYNFDRLDPNDRNENANPRNAR